VIAFIWPFPCGEFGEPKVIVVNSGNATGNGPNHAVDGIALPAYLRAGEWLPQDRAILTAAG
jgi:hypothetical protein